MIYIFINVMIVYRTQKLRKLLIFSPKITIAGKIGKIDEICRKKFAKNKTFSSRPPGGYIK